MADPRTAVGHTHKLGSLGVLGRGNEELGECKWLEEDELKVQKELKGKKGGMMVLDGIERETRTAEAEGELQSRGTNPNPSQQHSAKCREMWIQLHSLGVCCSFSFSLNSVLN